MHDFKKTLQSLPHQSSLITSYLKEADLAELMKDMDIKSEKELWNLLTESEQQAFIKSLKSGIV